jgi:hypothetical protein
MEEAAREDDRYWDDRYSRADEEDEHDDDEAD